MSADAKTDPLEFVKQLYPHFRLLPAQEEWLRAFWDAEEAEPQDTELPMPDMVVER